MISGSIQSLSGEPRLAFDGMGEDVQALPKAVRAEIFVTSFSTGFCAECFRVQPHGPIISDLESLCQ